MSANDHEEQAPDDSRATTRWLAFRIGSLHYALEILDLREVLAGVEVESVPGAPPTVLGIISLRGSIITVVDLRHYLNLAAARVDPHETGCVIVVDVGGEPLGVHVDAVAEIVNVIAQDIQPASSDGSAADDPLVRGIVNRDREAGVMTLLNLSRLVSSP